MGKFKDAGGAHGGKKDGGHQRGHGGGPGGGGGAKGHQGPAGKMIRKPREERFGNLHSQPDVVSKGKYIPWARSQKPGSVKEISFDADTRRSYLSGFRKRKTERGKVAKKNIDRKLKDEKKKERNEKHRELMDNYEARVKKMKEMSEEMEHVHHDSDESSDDSDAESEAVEEEPAQSDNTMMKFFDPNSGSATTVEVQEMDLEEIHSVSVAASTLPALPAPETPLGKKKKQMTKGRARIKKKEFQPKSKRDKHAGGRKKKK